MECVQSMNLRRSSRCDLDNRSDVFAISVGHKDFLSLCKSTVWKVVFNVLCSDIFEWKEMNLRLISCCSSLVVDVQLVFSFVKDNLELVVKKSSFIPQMNAIFRIVSIIDVIPLIVGQERVWKRKVD